MEVEIINTTLGVCLIGNELGKVRWFCGDARMDLALVSFSLVNVLSDKGCWLLHPGSSGPESLFLKLRIWRGWLQHS